MSAVAQVSARFTAIDGFSKAMTRMTSHVSKFGQRVEGSVMRANRAFSSMMAPVRNLTRQLGTLGVFIGGAALVGAVGGAVNVFKDFEQANANLSAVMASATEPQLIALQEDAKRLGSVTAKTATEVVGLQEAFARLGFETDEIINMTQATINGSVAMRGELSDTAELVGAMVRTFDDFSSVDAPGIINKMTLATQRSALNFEKLQTSLPIVAGAANAAGLSFDEMTALLGKLSDAGIDASSSATALRNILLESAKKGHSYDQVIENIASNTDKLTAANDAFGKRAAVSATILSKSMRETSELTNQLSKATNTSTQAQDAADKQLNTLGGSITLLGSAYEGFILSLESGNGAFATLLRNGVQVLTMMLTLASGTDVARDSLNAHEQKVLLWGERALKMAKIIGTVIGLLALWKGALMVATLATQTWALATKVATGVQWLFSAALNAGIWPLTLLVAAIALVIYYWDEWGATVTAVGGIIAAFTSPFIAVIALIVSIVMSLYRNWNMVVDAFSQGGIIDGLMAIGVVLLDAVLYPLQQLLDLISKIPGGIGDFAAKGSQTINELRTSLGVDTGEAATPEVVNPQATEQEGIVNTLERTTTERSELLIRDETGRAEPQGDLSNAIKVEPTFGF